MGNLSVTSGWEESEEKMSLELWPEENKGTKVSCDVERCPRWIGCSSSAFALGVLSSIFFEFCCLCCLVFLGILSASPGKAPLPCPSRLVREASWLTFLSVGVHGLLLLISCLFFMMFQLIHHTPCALEWNSTHTNPWRLKKSSQGIFRLFVCLTYTFNQPWPLPSYRLDLMI